MICRGTGSRKNIHVLDKLVFAPVVLQALESDLRDNGTKLATCCRDTVGGGPITSGEDLSRNDESGGVWTKVLEEIG